MKLHVLLWPLVQLATLVRVHLPRWWREIAAREEYLSKDWRRDQIQLRREH